MQIFVLLLMIGLLACNETRIDPPIRDAWLAAIVNGPYLVLALLAALACAVTGRRLRRLPHLASALLGRLDRVLMMIRIGTIGLFYIALFVLGYRTWLDQRIGVWLLVSDLLALAPPLGVVGVIWWAYYPIDRRLREASLIRRIDTGQPVWPILSRRQFLINQVRHQLLLMLMPLLALLAWAQIVDRLTQLGYVPAAMSPLMLGVGGIGVFLFAPLVIRHLWDTRPIPEGDLRRRLVELCRRHRVKVRELLLWRTYGGLINGAVMGLVGSLRYILLTDGLLEQLPPRQVEAVMAHELGHIRRRHMPWMIVCAMGLLIAVVAMVDLAATIALWAVGLLNLEMLCPWTTQGELTPSGDGLFGGVLTFGAVLLWAPLFGYISRRFERQADTFAVQHLTEARDETDIITTGAVQTMSAALTCVARLNNVPTSRPSWRHGSIRWRVDHLQSLVGQSVDACPIDRELGRLRYACLAIGLVAATLWLLTG